MLIDFGYWTEGNNISKRLATANKQILSYFNLHKKKTCLDTF